MTGKPQALYTADEQADEGNQCQPPTELVYQLSCGRPGSVTKQSQISRQLVVLLREKFNIFRMSRAEAATGTES